MFRTILRHMVDLARGTSAKMNGTINGISSNFLDLEVNRVVWMDMEMTGLDINKDQIMEIACLITDSELNILAESPNIIIHLPKEVLDDMNDWCTNQHGNTGLTQECLNSKIGVEDAENILFEFLQKHVTQKHSPLAGNSVIIDISSIKELCRRWNPEVYKTVPKKEFGHRALQDIRESVSELKFYKENFFKIC